MAGKNTSKRLGKQQLLKNPVGIPDGVLTWWLYFMIIEVFSNINNSMFLWIWDIVHGKFLVYQQYIPEGDNVTMLFDLLCSRQDILDWIRFPSCPLHMVAPLVFRSLCYFFLFSVLHLEYFFSSEPKLEDRQFESMLWVLYLWGRKGRGEHKSLENYLSNLSFLSTCLLSTYRLFCCWTYKKNLNAFVS